MHALRFPSLTLASRQPSSPVDFTATVAALFRDARLPSTSLSPLVLVPDRTRAVGLHHWLPPLVDAFEGRGAKSVRVLFASGTHEPMAFDERERVLGPDAQRVEHAAHHCDAADLIDLGGGPLHPWLQNSDALVVVSKLTPHYLAGVGGGRKMLFPGVTSRAVATAIHALTIDDNGERPAAIAAGVVEDNPMHRAIMERVKASKLPPLASLVVRMNEGDVVGARVHKNLEHDFEQEAKHFVEERSVTVPDALDGIWARCPPATGENLVQAHKTLQAASAIVRPGGRMVIEAALARGFGNRQMSGWLTTTAADLAVSLVDEFEIGKQTAFSLRRLLDAFDVCWTGVDPAHTNAFERAGLRIVDDDTARLWLGDAGNVASTVYGASVLYRVRPDVRPSL